jgi:hypothetical protein
MQTIMHKAMFKWILALLLVVTMFGYGASPSLVYASCPPDVSYDLYAKTGTTTLYSGSPTINIWGFSSGPTGATDPAVTPGITLTANQGQCIEVILHNVNIPGSVSLLFQGQNLVPDTAGVGAGSNTSYSFIAVDPGTFLYEAGLTPNGQTQVAMGLYGALVVNSSTPGQAYSSATSAFDIDEVLVLSEVDTSLNGNANPYSFDLRNYKPKYFLINGKAYPGTGNITAIAGDDLLFRYVNAGLTSHAMAVLGFSQRVIAEDGIPYAYARSVVSQSIPPGGTLDAIGTVPAATTSGSKFAVYDSNLMLRNNTGISPFDGFGGMVTFVTVGTPVIGPDTTGPATSNIGLPANAVNGTMTALLTATISDVTTGNSNVTAAEYFIDSTGANGTGTGMSGAFGTPTVSASATISGGTIGALSSGNHTIYVHGRDAANNWGPFALNILKVDNTPPNTTNPALSSNPANGTVNVTLTATGNDSTAGNSNIAQAEYWIDAGAHLPMTVVVASPTAGLTATIPAATIFALAQGPHTISIRSMDAINTSWGPAATITLTVDKTGPATSAVSATFNPNNGALPLNATVQAVRVSANFSDAANGNGNVVAGEGFIDTIGTSGTGFAFVASDGVFNSPTETGYADVPLVVINALSTGNHTIQVHGKDSAGNWGALGTVTLVIDRTPPTIVSITRLDPNPTTATSVNFLVTFSESVTGVASSNFSLTTTGVSGATVSAVSAGPSTTRTVTVSGYTGSGTIRLNMANTTGVADLAGNAMSATGIPFNGGSGGTYTILPPPQPNLYFSTSGNTNPPGVVGGGTADDADIYFWNGSATNRSIDVTTITNPLPTGANVDGFDRVDATHFYMSFTGTVTIALPGPDLTVEDEDIVYYNAGTWSLYFDGSANGLTGGAATDLDAINIVGAGGPGNIYFSTDNTIVPPGAGGSGDDADIYRWNGGSSYTRVVDASAITNPLPGGANVDGFVRVDATQYYLSFTGSTTISLPGPDLTVEDEDVVFYNAGTWSIYFDGSAVGLDTSGNLDIDAFDLP